MIMKSLQESMFDSDLVSKETRYEYLYGLVESAGVHSDFKIDYFDEKKIKRDFNSITKKFPPQQWSTNPLTGMDRFQKMDDDEILRELLYIITGKVKTVDIPIRGDGRIVDGVFENVLLDVVYDYIDPKYKMYVGTLILPAVGGKNEYNVYISFQLGKRWGRYGPNYMAESIKMKINIDILR